jgi:hypothetical protein
MKKVVLYSPSISSLNLGDHVITEAAKNEISFITHDKFVVEISTHLPLSYYYMRHFKDFDLRFVLGSNLLKSTFFGFKRQWDITLGMFKFAGPVVLVGAGWWQYGNNPNLYTKLLLKLYLSKKHLHSVRDDYTKKILNDLGFDNVINTSCPTMWKLTKEHCQTINKKKSSKVVFTLTDYNQDIELDRIFVNTLLEHYDTVFFWPQGTGDYEYFSRLDFYSKKLILLPPTMEGFDFILNEGNVDYIGTRLHGGIRALQKKIRSLIIGIDNRAEEKKVNFNLPVLSRKNIKELPLQINSDIDISINLPLENISKWKAQFDSHEKV